MPNSTTSVMFTTFLVDKEIALDQLRLVLLYPLQQIIDLLEPVKFKQDLSSIESKLHQKSFYRFFNSLIIYCDILSNRSEEIKLYEIIKLYLLQINFVIKNRPTVLAEKTIELVQALQVCHKTLSSKLPPNLANEVIILLNCTNNLESARVDFIVYNKSFNQDAFCLPGAEALLLLHFYSLNLLTRSIQF